MGSAVIDIIMVPMPEIAKNVAEPLSKVDKITMYGEGNSTKLIEDIVNGTSQVTEGVASGMGIDLKALVSGFLGGKVSQSGSTIEEIIEDNQEDISIDNLDDLE